MVETACENNVECIDSDSDTIENIVEKGIVVTVLADDPNYEYYLQKLTTPETVEQRLSDSWSGTFDRGSKTIRDRPFNLMGGGGSLWFFVSFRIFFSDNTS